MLLRSGLLLLSVLSSQLCAQMLPIPPQHMEPYHAAVGGAGAAVSSRATVQIAGVPWLRLHFSDVQLGPGTVVRLTGTQEGAEQTLDARALASWDNSSAYFNGDTIHVELVPASDDPGATLTVDRVLVGEWAGGAPPGGGFTPMSLCGADNRVASTDARVGRTGMGGCTAWLVSNGAVLTAGHCVDGTRPPDGTADLGGTIQFNVPASLANGTSQAAAPQDQYPVNTATHNWNFDGDSLLGKDWGVFGLNPNNANGDRAHVTRGFFRMTNESPAAGATIRVTGCGVDDTPAGSGGGPCCRVDGSGNCTSNNCNAQNVTLQTATGGYVGESSSGARFWHQYAVDTEPANSGSPIIWTANGFTIGIHTNAGCASNGTGANNGTSFEHDPLEVAIRGFPGANTTYVDSVSGHPAPSRNGTIFRPYATVALGATNVVSGGRISVVAGIYTAAAGNTFVAGEDGKSFFIEAPVGSVSIGD